MTKFIDLAARIPAPALDAVGILHPVNGGATRRHTLGQHGLLDGLAFTGGHVVAEPIERHEQRHGAFGGTLHPENLPAALGETVPFRIIHHALHREFRERELSRIAVHHINKRRALENPLRAQQVDHVVVQSNFVFEKIRVGLHIGLQLGLPKLRETWIAGVGADAR